MTGTDILGLIIGLILVVFVVDNAGKRGMNQWGWGIFTFFFGIIAWIIFLIARSPRLDDTDNNNDKTDQNENN